MGMKTFTLFYPQKDAASSRGTLEGTTFTPSTPVDSAVIVIHANRA
jgi:hypothetical protein